MAGVWTNNWKAVKNFFLLGGLLSDIRSGWSTIKRLDGTIVDSGATLPTILSPVGKYYNSNTPYNSGTTPAPYNAIVFGSGNGTPAATDFCLSAKWTANISRVSLSQSESYDDTTHTKTKNVTCTVQNTGTSAVTIREWGIESAIYGGSHILLYRALLDTPVTLAQYESATFTCTISLRLTDPG